MLKLTFEDTSIISSRARIQTQAATINCDTALLYQNSVSISPTTDLYVMRDVFFPVSGDIFPAVLYTVEHSIGQLKSSEHPNEAKSKPFGTNIYIV